MCSLLSNIKLKIRDMVIQYINCCIMMGLLLFAYIYWNNSSYLGNWASILTGVSLMLGLYQIFIFRIKKTSLMDYKFIFIALSHLFLFGQIYLIAFGYGDDIFYNVIMKYPSTLIFDAGLFSICYVQAIFIGFMYAPKRKDNSKLFLNNVNAVLMKRLMYKAGTILLVLSAPFKLYVDIVNVILTQSSSSYREVVSLSGISTDLAVLFVPSFIFIISSECLGKKTNKYLLLIPVLYMVVIMILTGDRRYYVTGIIAIMLCYLRIYTPKIQLKDTVKYSIIVAILLNLLAVIRTIRLTSLTTVGNFLTQYWKDLFKYNPLFEILSEFGSTALTVAFPIKLIPSYIPYQLGFSFYGTIPSLLPIGWLFGDYFNKVSIARLLNPIEGYPVGGSLTGDLYANFGWWGLLGAIIFGIALSKIFVIHDNKNHNFNIAIYYSAFYILINLVRASFIEIFRNTFIVVLVPMFIMYFLKTRYSKPSGNMSSHAGLRAAKQKTA